MPLLAEQLCGVWLSLTFFVVSETASLASIAFVLWIELQRSSDPAEGQSLLSILLSDCSLPESLHGSGLIGPSQNKVDLYLLIYICSAHTDERFKELRACERCL